MLFCRPWFFFLINFFQKKKKKKCFQEYHQSVKQFGARSGPTFCWAWSGSKLFAKVMSRWQKSPLVGKELIFVSHVPRVCRYYLEGSQGQDIFKLIKLYHSPDKLSRLQINIFHIVPRKLWHFMQIVWRQFAWNVNVSFLEKIRKTFQNVVCGFFYQHAEH